MQALTLKPIQRVRPNSSEKIKQARECGKHSYALSKPLIPVMECRMSILSVSDSIESVSSTVDCPEGCKLISLTKGQFAIVDECDYAWLSQWKWHYGADGYSRRGQSCREDGKKKTRMFSMHREIAEKLFGIPDGMHVDHVDRNKLNNRRSNLRLATCAQNRANRGVEGNNTSGFKGVCYHPRCNRWTAAIKFNGKRMHLGFYDTPEQAALAYNEEAIKLFGEFAYLNAVEGTPVERRYYEKHASPSKKYKGYWFCNRRQKWLAYPKSTDGTRVYIGRYDTEDEAIQAVKTYMEGLNEKQLCN